MPLLSTAAFVQSVDDWPALRKLLTGLAACYCVSAVLLATERTWPSIPWSFVPVLILFYIPFSYFALVGLYGAKETLERRGAAIVPLAFAITAGILYVFVLVLGNPALTLGLFGCFLVDLLAVRRRYIVPILLSVVLLFLLYGTVWNLNHLAGLLSLDRLLDAQLMRWDAAAYSELFGRPIPLNCDALFPLHDSWFWFHAMEAGYVMIFCEVFVVVLVLLHERRSLAPFFLVVLVAYVAAVAVFLVYPVVGPYHLNPASLRSEFQDTLTYRLMTELNKSYAHIKRHEPPGGYVYVVGLPSLHVAMAMIMQRFLWASRAHFWAFLPISTLMAISTCYLGHHYLLDSLAGLAFGAVLLAGDTWWRGRLSRSGTA